MKYTLAENLKIALSIAIREQTKEEKRRFGVSPDGDLLGKSALLAGWESTLADLENGEQITIVNES